MFGEGRVRQHRGECPLPGDGPCPRVIAPVAISCHRRCRHMVSPQIVFTYPLHHAKLQILLHGVTTNSLYLSSSPCKATNLTTWCHHKQSLLILFTMQSYKSYYMVSPQTVFTYPLHHAKLQILLHGVTANSLYLSSSPCKATSFNFLHIELGTLENCIAHLVFLELQK